MLKKMICTLLTGSLLFAVTACVNQKDKPISESAPSKSTAHDTDGTKTDAESPSTVSDWFSGAPKEFSAIIGHGYVDANPSAKIHGNWTGEIAPESFSDRYLNLILTEDFKRVGPTDIQSIFKNDSLFSRKQYNDAINYQYSIYHRIGYMDVSSYSNYLIEKYKELAGERFSKDERYKTDCKALYDPEHYTENASVNEFLEQAEAEGKTAVYYKPVYKKDGSVELGGGPLLVAYKKIGGTTHETLFSANNLSFGSVFENGDCGVFADILRKTVIETETPSQSSMTEKRTNILRDSYLSFSPTEIQKIDDFYGFEFRAADLTNDKTYTFLLTVHDTGDNGAYWLVGFYCPTDLYDAAKESFLRIAADVRGVPPEDQRA